MDQNSGHFISGEIGQDSDTQGTSTVISNTTYTYLNGLSIVPASKRILVFVGSPITIVASQFAQTYLTAYGHQN
jgi:hypothetical protein